MKKTPNKLNKRGKKDLKEKSPFLINAKKAGFSDKQMEFLKKVCFDYPIKKRQ